jgi:hypothetical protein
MLTDLFPIFFSPEDKGGGGGDDADEETEDLEEEQEEEEAADEEEEEEEFDKPLALETIRRQRTEFRDLKKAHRKTSKELADLKKSITDKEKSDLELAQQGMKESDARASKAEAALKDERLKSAIIRAAAVQGMRDPEDAYLNLKNSKSIEWEEEEYPFSVDAESVKDAVAKLKEEKPYLFEEESSRDDEDDDDLGGSPLHKKVRSRIRQSQRDEARSKRKASEALKPEPEVVISESL